MWKKKRNSDEKGKDPDAEHNYLVIRRIPSGN